MGRGASASSAARAQQVRTAVFIMVCICGSLLGRSCQLFRGRVKRRLVLVVFLDDLRLETLLVRGNTEGFPKLPVPLKRKIDAHLPRLRIGFGIVNGDVELHMLLVVTMEALDQVKRFAVRLSCSVNPDLIFESRGVHDEIISVPASDRI